MSKALLWGLGALVVIVAVTVISNTNQNPATAPADSENSGSVESPMPVPTDSGGSKTQEMIVVKEFTVTGSNYAFVPTTLTVKKGDTVKIVFKNSGGFHDFVIDEFNVSSGRINGGEETAFEFVADRAGTFEYYCSVGTHRAMGMKGTLTVTE